MYYHLYLRLDTEQLKLNKVFLIVEAKSPYEAVEIAVDSFGEKNVVSFKVFGIYQNIPTKLIQ